MRADTRGTIDTVEAKYELFRRSDYEGFNLPAYTLDAKTPLDLFEARNALRIARADQADQYASESFAKAQQALDRAEDYHKRKQKNPTSSAAREAIQMAEDARIISWQRKEEERAANERKAAAEREAQAKAGQQAEAQRRAEAEARQRAEAEARRKAEQERLQAELAAAKEAAKRAEADAARQAALLKEREAAEAAERARQSELKAKEVAEQARQAEQKAKEAAEQAQREKAELRAKLLERFNSVLPTTDTDRGLVVNMGDVLFDIGKADLRPPAREALARLSGIVLNYPSLKLAIEGHTDSTGSDELNQRLSEQRAETVRSYLQSQGLPADSLGAKGFGKTMPVADNSTAAGRQKNRRVEIVVSGEVIGAKIGAQ
jgi:outer membrane protein OmpA-like peptidoglycan-associated protein